MAEIPIRLGLVRLNKNKSTALGKSTKQHNMAGLGCMQHWKCTTSTTHNHGVGYLAFFKYMAWCMSGVRHPLASPN